MKWKQFTVKTTTEAEDLVSGMLSDLGITGVEVQDHMQIMDGDTFEVYKDVMPEQLPDDGLADVIFYTEEDADTGKMIADVMRGLEDLRAWVNVGAGTIETGETEDVDWVNNWKKHFHAFYVDDILVKPTWVEKPEDDHSSMMIEIDPGTAFGTGSHETTQLSIRALRKYLKGGERVLDAGTGSGILGIVALKTGASHCLGVDIDPLAISAAAENIALNGIKSEDFPVRCGNIIGDEEFRAGAALGTYDVVVANILADILIPMQEAIGPHMKQGALMILSGIINIKEDAVRTALEKNPALEIIDTQYQGDWVSFTARRI